MYSSNICLISLKIINQSQLLKNVFILFDDWISFLFQSTNLSFESYSKVIVILEKRLLLLPTHRTHIRLVTNVSQWLGLLLLHRHKVLHRYQLRWRQVNFSLTLFYNRTATPKHQTIPIISSPNLLLIIFECILVSYIIWRLVHYSIRLFVWYFAICEWIVTFLNVLLTIFCYPLLSSSDDCLS